MTLFILSLLALLVLASGTAPLDPAALARFQEYLRIDTAQPQPDYEAAASFLVEQANQLGLTVSVLRFVPTKPLVLMTWAGSEPSLPSLLLNSHTDVVPAEADKWSHPPFGAEVDDTGKLFARGSQDSAYRIGASKNKEHLVSPAGNESLFARGSSPIPG